MRLDEKMPECLLYLADSAHGKFSYEVPYGRAEQQTGSAGEFCRKFAHGDCAPAK